MADEQSFGQQLSDIQISQPVPPPQFNTGSTAGDIVQAGGFVLDLLQRRQQANQAKKAQEAQVQMTAGVNRILQNKADRDSQGIGVQQNLLQTQQEMNALRSNINPAMVEEANKLLKSGLGFSPSAKITDQQVSQYDQERDKLNSVGIDTRDMGREEITTTYLQLNKREADLESKNAAIRSQIDSLNLQAKTRENKEAISRLQQRELYNSIRSVGVVNLEEQKRVLNRAKASGNPQAIKEAQQQFLQMASEAESFFTSSMVQASQQLGITLDDGDLNSQAAGVRAWSDSLIKSEDNSVLSEANKRKIDLVTSDMAMRIISESPEISTYATLASLKIPVDPISSQLASTKGAAIIGNARKSGAYDNLMKQVPGDNSTTRQENDLQISKGYLNGQDLLDSLRGLDAAGKLPPGQLDTVFDAKMADERDIAKQIMDGAIEMGGGQAGSQMQGEAEGVLFSAVNTTMKRAIDTGDLSRLGPGQVGYVLDVISHPNYEQRAPQEVKDAIKGNLGQFTSQVFEKQYFNDAALTIAQDLGNEEFDVPPLQLTTDARGNMRWIKNPEFTATSREIGLSQAFDLATNPNLIPGQVMPSQTTSAIRKDYDKRIDQLVVKLNKSPVANQLIDANAKVQGADKKQLADFVVARSQANLSALDRKMFKVSDEVIAATTPPQEETTEQPTGEVVEQPTTQIDETTISEVASILKENPDTDVNEILEFFRSRNQ